MRPPGRRAKQNSLQVYQSRNAFWVGTFRPESGAPQEHPGTPRRQVWQAAQTRRPAPLAFRSAGLAPGLGLA